MKKVLLIDDSITIHRVIDICLDKEKFTAEKTFSADEAVIKLKNSPADIILLDNKLAGINLADFVKKIRTVAPHAWIILLTGAFDQFSDADLAKSGADDYLYKPFDSHAIEQKMNYGLSHINTTETESTVTDIPELPKNETDENEIEAYDTEDNEYPVPERTAKPAEMLHDNTEQEELGLPEEDMHVKTPMILDERYDEEDGEENPYEDEPASAVSDEEKTELGNMSPEPVIADSVEENGGHLASLLDELSDEDEKATHLPETDFKDFMAEISAENDTEPADSSFPAFEIDDKAEQEPENAKEQFDDLFNNLKEINIDEIVAEAPVEQLATIEQPSQLSNDTDLFSDLIPEDDAEPNENYSLKPNEPELAVVEPSAAEFPVLATHEGDIPASEHHDIDMMLADFDKTDEPLDGVIVEEKPDVDLEMEAVDEQPIDADFTEMELDDKEPVIIREDLHDSTGEEMKTETLPFSFNEDEEDIDLSVKEPEEALVEEEKIETEDSDIQDSPFDPESLLTEEDEIALEDNETEEPFKISDEEAEREIGLLPAFADVDTKKKEEPAKKQLDSLGQEEIKDIVYRSLDSGMLKAAIQEVLSEKMEEVLREVLPEIAEMVIREEIERLKRGE